MKLGKAFHNLGPAYKWGSFSSNQTVFDSGKMTFNSLFLILYGLLALTLERREERQNPDKIQEATLDCTYPFQSCSGIDNKVNRNITQDHNDSNNISIQLKFSFPQDSMNSVKQTETYQKRY